MYKKISCDQQCLFLLFLKKGRADFCFFHIPIFIVAIHLNCLVLMRSLLACCFHLQNHNLSIRADSDGCTRRAHSAGYVVVGSPSFFIAIV